MKDKVIKVVAIATVTMISGALVAYLKNPENRLAVKKFAKKASKKAKKQIKYLEYRLK